jgi:hypothetical protein
MKNHVHLMRVLHLQKKMRNVKIVMAMLKGRKRRKKNPQDPHRLQQNLVS